MNLVEEKLFLLNELPKLTKRSYKRYLKLQNPIFRRFMMAIHMSIEDWIYELKRNKLYTNKIKIELFSFVITR